MTSHSRLLVDPPAWLHPLAAAIRSGRAHSALPHAARYLGDTREAPAATRRHAAVLMVFSGSSVETGDIILTHRAPTLSTHAGQVSFPGGRIDSTDAGPIAAALREAWEETGLRESELDVFGVMDPVYIPRTNYEVVPVAAYWRTPSTLTVTSPDEALRVMRVPLRHLIDPAQRFSVTRGNWCGPAFHLDELVLWGFTAGVISALLATAGWEQPWDRRDRRDLTATLAASGNQEKLLSPAELAARGLPTRG